MERVESALGDQILRLRVRLEIQSWPRHHHRRQLCGRCELSITTLDILNVFVEFPGNLVFFLLVIALSQGSLFLAFGHRSRFPFEQATRRFVYATGGLVILWLIMLAVAFLSQLTELEADAIMPPLERLVQAVTLLILAWAFLSADFLRWQNRSNLLVFAAAFILALLYVNSARGWLAVFGRDLAFNSTEHAQQWSGVTAALAALGLLLVIMNYRHIVDAPLKVLFFIVLLVGNGWDVYQMGEGNVAGNYLGATRLAYLAGLILLPLIIYRLAIALLEHSLVEVVLAASQPSSAVMPSPAPAAAPAGNEVDALLAAPSSWNFGASPVPSDRRHLLHAISLMLETRDGARIPEQIVRATQETLQLEVCALLRVQENNYADVIAGHDQVADQSLAGISLNLNEQPTLREAATRLEQTILFPEYHEAELQDLFRRLNIASICSLYGQPLAVEGELIAVMLVAMPYRQADLSPEELEWLRDISDVAGHLLAWSDDRTSSSSLSQEQVFDEIAERSADAAIDQEALIAHRLEFEASLARVNERREQIFSQVADLLRQQEEQQVRLLDALAAGEQSPDATQRLNATFDEQVQLRAASEASARALLDAETILRVLNADDDDALAQVIREYVHKDYNLLLTARDRLRRQINALLVMGRSVASEGYAAILQTLADESAQLELERDQQQRRLESIRGRMDSLGLDVEASHLTQLLIQLYAERKTFTQYLAAANQDRRKLVDARKRLMDSGGGKYEDLERKLKHLSADHEQLMNSREELRRDAQDLRSRLEDAHAEKSALQANMEALQAEAEARVDRQNEMSRQVDGLLEERDNLLKIRDQLTAKVNAMQAEEVAREGEADLNDDIVELQSSLQRLTAQREQLALDLSDARAELSVARESLGWQASETEVETQEHQPNVPELFAGILDNLRTPMSSISDYIDLLLAESIGILGAAQRQVLTMIAVDIDRIAAIIGEIQQLSSANGSRFGIERGSIDLLSIIEDVLLEAEASIEEKGHMIELALDDELPPVSADGASLKHILAQFVFNASAVSPAGSRITVSARVGPLELVNGATSVDAIEIRVSDKGGGISLEDRQRIFARTYRAENRKIIGYGDSGVGMTVARAFARALNGDLWITSEAGVGSAFHLALPLELATSIED